MAGEVYTVRVHHEPGEDLWAEVLELPGCFAAGADPDRRHSLCGGKFCGRRRRSIPC